MADPVELRKLVKQLQSAPTPAVRTNLPMMNPFSLYLCSHPFFQDILGVLSILKDQQNVTEAVLRVCIYMLLSIY